MMLKIRYRKTITLEAVVEVVSGLSRDETLAQLQGDADQYDLWEEVSESDSPIEIVEEVGRIPTIRGDKND